MLANHGSRAHRAGRERFREAFRHERGLPEQQLAKLQTELTMKSDDLDQMLRDTLAGSAPADVHAGAQRHFDALEARLQRQPPDPRCVNGILFVALVRSQPRRRRRPWS